MSPNRLGYACINSTLGGETVPKKQRVTTNRTLRLATAHEKGIPYIASLVASNVRDLHTILEWNEAKGITLFRMSSEMFPFIAHPDFSYAITDLDQYAPVSELLRTAGQYALDHNHRLSFHPGPFKCSCFTSRVCRSQGYCRIGCHCFYLRCSRPPSRSQF